MKNVLSGLILALQFSALAATAQDNPDVQGQGIDTQRFCVYDGSLYSIGSIVKVGEVMLECRLVPRTPENEESGTQWMRL